MRPSRCARARLRRWRGAGRARRGGSGEFSLRRTLAASTAARADRAARGHGAAARTIHCLAAGRGAGPRDHLDRPRLPRLKRARTRGISGERTIAAAQAPIAIVRESSNPRITGAITRSAIRETSPKRTIRAAGINVGSFTLRSILDLSAGYDSNALRTPGGPGSWFYVIAPQFSARSNWTRHELNLDLRGSYMEFLDVPGNNRPEAFATARGKIDVTSLTRIEFEGRAALTTENPGSPDAVAGVVRPPNVYALGTTLGVVRAQPFASASRPSDARFESAELTRRAGRSCRPQLDATPALPAPIMDVGIKPSQAARHRRFDSSRFHRHPAAPRLAGAARRRLRAARLPAARFRRLCKPLPDPC